MRIDPESSAVPGSGEAVAPPPPKPGKRPLTPKQRAALDAGRRPFKPGYDPRRNQAGVNGTTKARARIEALINANSEDMVEVLIQLAKSGDVQALRLVTQHLLPALPRQAIEMSGGISFTWGTPESRPEETGKQVG